MLILNIIVLMHYFIYNTYNMIYNMIYNILKYAQTLGVQRLRFYIFGFQQELLNRKLAEIQRKFDNELLYHLEIIKKQKREIKLQSQILEKIEPMLSKKCNYRYINISFVLLYLEPLSTD